MKRKLTTIFCADVSGYSRLMGADEARTLATLKEYREAIEGFIARHHGRVVSWSGDGLLAEFASVVEAVQCAAEVQRELKARNSSLDEDRRMTFRIGINLGDVMVDGDDIFGEGVNIAARLQQMAVPGGILISSPVYDQVRGKLSMTFAPLGTQTVKNIAGEVTIYAVGVEGESTQAAVMPARPSWGDDSYSPPPVGAAPEMGAAMPQQPARRGKLFRRGFALILDYMIVGGTCLAAALIINSSVNPNVVRMDLDLPFIEYGDMVHREPWRTIRSEVEDDARIVTQERLVTYSYWDLFQQTYRQTRTRGGVTIREGKETKAPAEPATPAAPAPAVAPAPAPPPPPPPPEAGAPPAPPAPPAAQDVPSVVVEDGKVIIDGEEVVDVDEIRERAEEAAEAAVEAAQVAADAAVGDDEIPEDQDPGIALGLRRDKESGGLRFFGSFVSEQLVDPATGRDITRPSLDTLSLVLLVLYFALMEMGRRGSTIGKSAFNLLVTRENGAPLNFGTALGRNIIKVLSIFILPIAVLVMLLSRRRQGIHDRIAGTVVVREEAGFTPTPMSRRELRRDRRREGRT